MSVSGWAKFHKCRLRNPIHGVRSEFVWAASPHLVAEKFVNSMLRTGKMGPKEIPSDMVIHVITTDEWNVDREVAVDIRMEPVAHARQP